MNGTLVETIQTLQRRAARLEQEAAELRSELAQVVEVLSVPSSVIARYVVDDETIEITQADVVEAQKELAKSWTDDVVYELAAAKKLANVLRERPLAEQSRYLFDTVEAIRSAAIADGTAIDTEVEAAIDD
ncbi:MAG TPA: hypothetical protein ENJ93_01420 [Chloroflexi bacterium]|nr:hypothetical protein [Chloroflexota bacterium]